MTPSGVSTAGYVNPLGQIVNLRPQRIDQGVDYAGSGTLLSPCNGTVTMVAGPNVGWPALNSEDGTPDNSGHIVVVQFSDGAYAGKSCYFAENITPLVTQGQTVTAGQSIATLYDFGANLECGWWSGPGATDTTARTLGQTYGEAAMGASWNAFLVALGAPSGIHNTKGGPYGLIPTGYPPAYDPTAPVPSTPALASSRTAADKLAAVTSVPEPKDINYRINPVIWNYDAQGNPDLKFDFTDQVTGLRLMLSTSQASTVEVDLEDSDFQVLNDPLFSHWSFTIEDVSVSSMRRFRTAKLTNSTNTTRLGDSADLEWVLGQRPIDMQVGDVYFRLCTISAQQTTVTLAFEDRVASRLRQKRGVKSWDRTQHTRAQFVAMLCREAGVDYFIPEINVAQPVAINLSANGDSTQTQVTGQTISPSALLTVKGVPATPTQRRIASAMLSEAHNLNAPYNAMVALIYAAMGESVLGAASANVLQTTGTAYKNGTDYAGQAHGFLTGGTTFGSPGAIAAANRGDPVWQIANETEVNQHWLSTGGDSYASSFPGGQEFGLSEAEAFVQAFGGPNTVGSSTSLSTATGSYGFTRGVNEDSWDCIQRLASEVAWYAFVRQNKLWFVSGTYLFQQESQLSAEINKDGVTFIDPDLDMGARDQIAQCDIYAHASLWAALPGMMVDVVNRGPATGKWMVGDVQVSPLDPTQDAQITVYKPIPKRSEPSKDNMSSSNQMFNVSGSAGPSVLAAYQAAQALSAKQLVYTQHKRQLAPLAQIPQGATWYDCSSAVSEVLWLAGFALPGGASKPGDWTPVSGDFVPGQAGLVAGEGRYMTIWSAAEHAFIEFNLPGIGHFQGNTVSGQSGFRLFDWNSPTVTAGWGGPNPGTDGAVHFSPVHYPGT